MPGSAPTLPFAYELLYERLRQEGFRVGVDHQLRLQRLLAVPGVTSERIAPKDLKMLLCPLFATNRAQQEAFYRIFHEAYGGSIIAAAVNQETVKEAQTERRPFSLWSMLARPGVELLLLLLLGGVITAGVKLAEMDILTLPAPPPLPAAPKAPTVDASTSVPPPPSARPIERTATIPIQPEWITQQTFGERNPYGRSGWVFIGLPFLALGLLALFRSANRRATLTRQSGLKPPHYWPLKLESLGSKIYKRSEIQQLASRMRRRQDGPDGILDVPGTITETIRKAGFMRFVFRSLRRPPEYIVLIERQSAADHFTALIGDLTRLLEKEGVHLARYYFDHDPYRLSTDKGDEILLVDLAGATPGYRLLAFGSSGTFLHPISGHVLDWVSPALEKWPMRAMLVEDAPGRRRLTRLEDDAGLCIAPASVAGVAEVVEFFDAGGAGSGRPFPPFGPLPDPPAMEPLDRADPLAPAISACAIYPELNWNLTLRLVGEVARLREKSSIAAVDTRPLKEAALAEPEASRLSRVSYFRKGDIPPHVREELVNQIPDDARPALQKSLVSLLQSQMPPKDTFAWEQWQSVLRVHGEARRPWWRFWQRSPEPAAATAQDYVFLRFLDWRPKSLFDFVMTERTKHWLFEDGLRSLGVRTLAWLPVALVASLVLAFSFTPWKNNLVSADSLEGVVVDGTTVVEGVVLDGPDLDSANSTYYRATSDENGQFHLRLVAGEKSFTLKTVLWPPNPPGLTTDIPPTLTVHRDRKKIGPIAWYGIVPYGKSFLLIYEGETKTVALLDASGYEVKGQLTQTNDGALTPDLPSGQYEVRIDGKAYGKFAVDGPPPASARPRILSFGGKTQLAWSIQGADAAQIVWPKQATLVYVNATKGTLAFPPGVRDFTLIATNAGGASTQKYSLPDVSGVAQSAVTLLRFEANPPQIRKGQSTTLSWETKNATPDNLRIVATEAGGKPVDLRIWGYNGLPDNAGDQMTFRVTPQKTTTYQILGDGKVLRLLQVVVEEPAQVREFQLRLTRMTCGASGPQQTVQVEILREGGESAGVGIDVPACWSGREETIDGRGFSAVLGSKFEMIWERKVYLAAQAKQMPPSTSGATSQAFQLTQQAIDQKILVVPGKDIMFFFSVAPASPAGKASAR